MGLKFLCHLCEHPMHVKDFLAGKRGKCPQCGGSIRIPANGEEYSLPISADLKGTESTNELANEVAAVTTTNDHRTHVASVVTSKATSTPNETRTPSDRATSTTEPAIGFASASSSGPAKPTTVIPEVISEAPNAAWYVRPPSGGQYGPAIGSVFWDWLNEKRVGENSLVWREGWGTWQTAKEVFPDFFRPSPIPATAKPPQAPPAPEPVTPPLAAVPPQAPLSKAPTSQAASHQATFAQVVPVSQPQPMGIDSTAESRRSVQIRRKRSHSQNLVLLVGLSLVALILVVVLVVVLVMQSGS